MSSLQEHILAFIQNPIPHYVLVCLPAVATIGTSPYTTFKKKIFWTLRCLGCPFTGLFYSCNTANNDTAICAYWLSSVHFRVNGNENNTSPICRPVGHYSMIINPTTEQKVKMSHCVSNPSMLERVSSGVSFYYICVGIFIGISRVIGPCTQADWPYISLALGWTLPAVLKRVRGGKVVINDPRRVLEDEQILVNRYPKIDVDDKNVTDTHVTLTAFASILIPWIVVLLAYFTPPVGFGCRSKFLSVLCSIWTVNSIIAYFYHIFGKEKYVSELVSLLCLTLKVGKSTRRFEECEHGLER
ncbi:19084_t:CDS:2 [Cetraspora pellucida]|uniref:19084_t:CDS:1 n=1 Tax=Cetraspora pellucida TaxID=1433469 RepID=A0A9N9H1G0_9GLOM|nr:19084_t:CDS:2 [Cetraspora pellucida]